MIIIGLSPFERAHITAFHESSDQENNDSDFEVFYGDKYSDMRILAAQEILRHALKIKEGTITIKNAKMSTSPGSKILWITTTEEEVKQMYVQAARRKSKEIRLKTYFPPILYPRMLALERILREEKNMNPRLQSQIRLGKRDLELYTRHIGEFRYMLTSLNAFGQLPTFNTISNESFSPRGKERLPEHQRGRQLLLLRLKRRKQN